MSTGAALDTGGRAAAGRPFAISNGSLEALKWIALVSMTVDHLNKYLAHGQVQAAFAVGRLAMPLFLLVLACNLARPGAIEAGAGRRTVRRLLAFGAVASVPFIGLGGLVGGWWPLNALFTLATVAAAATLLHGRHRAAAVAVVLVGGSSVEFWWPAVVMGLAAWFFFRAPGWVSGLLTVGACACLGLINGNQWAMAALPLFALASRIDLRMPRLRWGFYAFYPLHLAAIWLARSIA